MSVTDRRTVVDPLGQGLLQLMKENPQGTYRVVIVGNTSELGGLQAYLGEQHILIRNIFPRMQTMSCEMTKEQVYGVLQRDEVKYMGSAEKDFPLSEVRSKPDMPELADLVREPIPKS